MKYAAVKIVVADMRGKDDHKIPCEILNKWPSDYVLFIHPSKLLVWVYDVCVYIVQKA
jgi:hypothetical protein